MPALVELRRRAEEMAGAELERTLRRIEHRTDYARGQEKLVEQEVAQMAHRIVAKLLHTPTVRLKEHAAHGNGIAYAEALEELFALGEQDEQPPFTNGNGRHG